MRKKEEKSVAVHILVYTFLVHFLLKLNATIFDDATAMIMWYLIHNWFICLCSLTWLWQGRNARHGNNLSGSTFSIQWVESYTNPFVHCPAFMLFYWEEGPIRYVSSHSEVLISIRENFLLLRISVFKSTWCETLVCLVFLLYLEFEMCFSFCFLICWKKKTLVNFYLA